MENRRSPTSDSNTDPTSPICRLLKPDSDTDSDSDSDIAPAVPFRCLLKTDSEILDILKTIPTAPLTLSDLPRSSIRKGSNRSFPEAINGVIFGRLIFSDNGVMIDCTKIGKSGICIPHIDGVGDMQSDALFILLVEKFDTYFRLVEDCFYIRFPCIIVRTDGQADVATRLFLRKMKMELRLHILALVDSDPNGLKCLSLFGSASKKISYDSSNLTTLDIKWLGIRPSDLDKYKIPEQCRLRMTKQDIKTGKTLLEDDFVKKNPRWIEELTLMVKTKQMAEIEALSFFGVRYLTEFYLPLKLQQQDWI